jgi:DNA-binding transcriptional LysR family regulator
MELRHLKTLVAIAEHRTFAAAAEALCMTQSAVSQQIKALEQDLGVELFDRGTRPPALSLHGQTLVEKGRRIISLCEEATSTFSEKMLSGTLHLGAIRTSQTAALPKGLSIMRKKYPELHFRVNCGSSEELVAKVFGGQLDAAIICGLMNLGTGLRWLPFTDEPLMVVAPADTRGKTERELLEGYPFIRFNAKNSISQFINDDLGKRGFKLNQEMEFNTFRAIAAMVANGLCVSVMPQQAVSQPFQENVKKIPFGDPPLHRYVGLIDRKNNPKSPLVDALWQELWQLSGSPDFP